MNAIFSRGQTTVDFAPGLVAGIVAKIVVMTFIFSTSCRFFVRNFLSRFQGGLECVYFSNNGILGEVQEVSDCPTDAFLRMEELFWALT